MTGEMMLLDFLDWNEWGESEIRICSACGEPFVCGELECRTRCKVCTAKACADSLEH